MKTIGIFPASGALGTSVYTHLLSQIPHKFVTLISRFPDKIPKSFIQGGATTRQASYESPSDNLETAFEGVDVLFLISYPSHVHKYRTTVHHKAIDAARRAGVKHIFYSSLAFALPNQDVTIAEVMAAHLDTESYLRKLSENDPSFSWTCIREGLYSESFPIYTAFFDINGSTSEILIPHDGSGPGVGWVKRDELGEATAKIMTRYLGGEGNFEYTNKTVVLTGPREWSLAETVKVLSSAVGREVRIGYVDVDRYVNQPQILEAFGSKELATTWATAWDAIRAGETAPVTGTLREELGREPEAFETTISTLVKSEKCCVI